MTRLTGPIPPPENYSARRKRRIADHLNSLVIWTAVPIFHYPLIPHPDLPTTASQGAPAPKPRVLVPERGPGQRTAYGQPADEASVAAIINKYREEPGNLLPILLGVNRHFNWLPRPALEHVSDELHMPMAEILRVATFYNAFSLVPRGKYIISVCLGTGCFVKGSPRLLERLERELKIQSGGTTEDMLFSLEPVRCIGCCALAPAVRVNEDTFGRLTPERIPKILKLYTEPLAAQEG